MPAQQPGKSRQDYGTPPEFVRALEKRLGIVGFSIDLAATKENSLAPHYFDEGVDSLKQPWGSAPAWNFCNPPYGDIGPWVKKAFHESINNSAQIAMLVPASVGSNWWSEWVHYYAYVTFVRPRLTFMGAEDPYPKDLAVLLYAPYLDGGSCVWRWK